MQITVLDDRIMIGTQFVPRYLTAARRLVVPEGQTVTLDPDSEWDYIEVGGTLTVPRTRNTRLRTIHLFILPTGFLDFGTLDAPIAADKILELEFREAPIDLAIDPWQWGNGLLNFGRQSRCGAPKLAHTTVVGDLAAGATTIELEADPVGWRVDDELLIPDTATVPLGISDQPPNRHRRESPISIKAINGRRVTLSKGLDFAHARLWEPDTQNPATGAIIKGTELLHVPVVNLTRNIKLRAANPSGVRAHTANVGHGLEHAKHGAEGMWCICFNESHDLGRTTIEALNNTTADAAGNITHLGTNVVGRYMDHDHHAQGYLASRDGNVLRDGAKWGLAVHQTHDGGVRNNVAIDMPGAGFVTEDGPETRNVFDNNFSAYIFGNAPSDPFTMIAHQNMVQGRPGVEGSGYWIHGPRNSFLRNHAWCCFIGMNFFNVDSVFGPYPSTPGGPDDAMWDNLARINGVPIAWEDNVTACSPIINTELWGCPNFPMLRHIAAYSEGAQIFGSISDPMRPHPKDARLVGYNGTGIGFASGMPYTQSLKFEGTHIVGNALGVTHGGQFVEFTECLLANVIDEDYRTPDQPFAGLPVHGIVWTNVLRRQLVGHPFQSLMFGNGDVWEGGGDPPPMIGLPHYGRQMYTSPYIIKNWQGTGQDYQLLQPQQSFDTVAWHSEGKPGYQNHRWNNPPKGMLHRESWAKFGIGYEGDAFDPADVVVLPGIVNGFARPGITSRKTPPRAIVTWPTARTPATVSPADNVLGPFVLFYGTTTGDPDGCNNHFVYSVDGGPRQFTWFEDAMARLTMRAYTSIPGVHEIRTWRRDASGTEIPSSEMAFTFQIGGVPDPEPEPEPEPIPLLVTCPADITVRATDPGGVLVFYPAPVASGGTAPYTMTTVPASGAYFPVGETFVAVTVKDANGETDANGFLVTVNPPIIVPPDPPSGSWVTESAIQRHPTEDRVRVVFADGTWFELKVEASGEV